MYTGEGQVSMLRPRYLEAVLQQDVGVPFLTEPKVTASRPPRCPAAVATAPSTLPVLGSVLERLRVRSPYSLWPFRADAWDMVFKQTGGHEPGWRDVSVHDHVVKDAASHAVKSIQERWNSLFLYELLEITRAKAEMVAATHNGKTAAAIG